MRFEVLLLTMGLAACSAPETTQAPTEDATGQPKTPVAFAELKGDAAVGEAKYAQCRTCHSLEEGKNLTGPSLHGIIGRPAGQVAGYNYTPANKSSGLIWTAEQMFTYLETPRTTIPGTKMTYAGLKDPQARADLIAYIAANGGAAN